MKAFNDFESPIKEYKEKFLHFYKSSEGKKAFNECLDDISSCQTSHFLAFSSQNADTPFSLGGPWDSYEKKYGEAVLLVSSKCSNWKIFESKDTPKMARLNQIACIKDHTKDRPDIRAIALSNIMHHPPNNVRPAFCDKYETEKKKHDKIIQCLKNPDSTGDSHFWEKMTSLYLQGMNPLN